MLLILAAIESIENERQRKFVEVLYQRYSPWVLSYAYKLVGNYDASQDILNDTFIRIIRYVDQIMELEEYKVGPYIKRIITSVSMEYISKETSEKQKAEKWKIIQKNEAFEDINIEKLLYKIDAEEILIDTMECLDERDRTLLICKYSFDMSYKEISEEMKIPEGNIGAYIKRAKQRFMKVIKKGEK